MFGVGKGFSQYSGYNIQAVGGSHDTPIPVDQKGNQQNHKLEEGDGDKSIVLDDNTETFGNGKGKKRKSNGEEASGVKKAKHQD